MKADEGMKRVIAYGADEEGIRDRFGDDAELYEMCLREFLEEPNFAVLAEAMDAGDYARAFDAAHAMKGLSGNLGVTPIYDAICVLVESLRAGRYGDVAAEYAEVRRQFEELNRLFSDAPAEAAAAGPRPAARAKTEARTAAPKKPRDRHVPLYIVLILAALLLVSFLFCRMGVNYRRTIVEESGRHLEEMSKQIKLYLESRISYDWSVAYSVGDSLMNGSYLDGDTTVSHMLRRKREVWGVSDLVLHTENGDSINADGGREKSGVASAALEKAFRQGRSLAVDGSRILYTVPVETRLSYNGSLIVAVSVVQDVATLLDDMEFSNFNESAWMYLTEENGVVISMLTNDKAVQARNFRSVAENMNVAPLSGDGPAGDYLSAAESEEYILSNETDSYYMISLPVATGSERLHLFYLVPEARVNESMNSFSRQLTVFSLVIIFLFTVLAFLLFHSVYKSRKKLFDRALLSRERMFDLLVKNTRTAFALFTAGQAEPTYISGNAAEVIGDRWWTLDRNGAGYRMRSDGNTESVMLRQANAQLEGWDGRSAFKSGYIRDERAVPPYCFEFQLYPTDTEGMDFVGVAQDMTQAYEREEATRAALEMATKANEAKSNFLSSMSHDIRTPMNAIMNMTIFAQENIDQPKKLGPYLHTIRESSEHLLHLINDVLDMSRIESGQTDVASAPFNLRLTLQRQVDIVRPLCGAKGQTLLANFSGLRTEAVCGDSLKLSQIVMNLLSNAVKFTPEKGAVRFTVTEIPSLRDDMVDMRLTVEDNGIGISEEDMTNIFEPFSRANDLRISRIEGTGLGLSICKSYVDAMGGTIHCESEAGEGSVFTVELFFQKADEIVTEAAPAAASGEHPFLGMHCLAVEDNPTNRMIAKALLERVGFIVDFAEDGAGGVKRFLASKPGTYDVIYMDIQMPVLDGYQASMRIRESEHPQAKTIPIVAMTANAFAEDIEKARVAGMDAYLGKPIVSFDLIEQTGKAIEKKGGRRR